MMRAPSIEANEIVDSFYYSLPNNGSISSGINSCKSRYEEAIDCGLILINKIISIAYWEYMESGSSEEKEYWHRVKEEVEKLRNNGSK